MLREVLEKTKEGQDASATVDALGDCGVCLELPEADADTRCFLLPGRKFTRVRETTFGEAGLGYSVWDSGIALSIWMGMNPIAFTGRRVLELGSGVGVAGISCGKVGAGSVVMSDFGKVVGNVEENQGMKICS